MSLVYNERLCKGKGLFNERSQPHSEGIFSGWFKQFRSRIP